MLKRITFVTIGQTPRSDLVPEIVAHLPASVDIAELGALDGLDSDDIAGLEPGADDHALVTRLRDGTQAVIGKRWVTERLRQLLDGIGGSAQASGGPTGSEATVLLCTGDFSNLGGPGLFLDAQHLVDGGVDGLCRSADAVGLLVPLARQAREHHYVPADRQRLQTAHASPYADEDFEAIGRELADCELIVMHCMGYTEAQQAAVAKGSGRPVLLARRLVSSALAQLL